MYPKPQVISHIIDAYSVAKPTVTVVLKKKYGNIK